MKSSFCIDLQRFMLIPTKFPLTRENGLTVVCLFLNKVDTILQLFRRILVKQERYQCKTHVLCADTFCV